MNHIQIDTISMNSKQKPQKKVTIVDIAHEAGTSISTVSYVLNNGPRSVSYNTRQRILEIIQRHSFAPNKIARSLKRRKSMSLGVVFPEMTNIYFPETLGGILEVTQNKDYNIILRNASNDPRFQKECISDLIAQGVDGLIIRPVEHSLIPQSLTKSSIPFVVVDRREGEWIKHSSIYVNNKKAIEMAVGILRQAGHSRIAMINGPQDALSAMERAEGFREAFESGGIISWGGYSQENGYTTMKTILQRHTEITAIVTGSTKITLGALQRVRDENKTVPADISLVAYGYSKWFSLFSPAITTVEQPVHEMGRRAAEAILLAIGPQRSLSEVVDESVDPIIVDGITHLKHHRGGGVK